MSDYSQPSEQPAASAEEVADCKAWLKRIEEAREFDKPARKGYAVDRRYARGDSGQFEVDVPIAGTYIDILASFLYARDPDVDCLPAESAGPARLEDARQFGKTLELVIRRLWKKGQLKKVMEPAVRSSITTGPGWFKAAWMERQNRDPVLIKRIDDLQDNIARLNALAADVESGEGQDTDAKRAELEQAIQGLQSEVEVVIARGLGIDFIPAEDVQVSPNVPSLACYLDAPWIAHRVFMPMSDAKAEFPELGDKLKRATTYYQCKPVDPTESRDTGMLAEVGPEEADSHKPGGGISQGGEGSVCVWEIQCRDSNMILTLIEGLDCYARPPMPPNPGTSRFYNLFLWAPGIVDGQRHPQSLVNRSARLFDEYNRVRSAFAEHRRRAIPKLAFDAGNLGAEEVKKLEAGGTGEMIPLKPLRPGEPIGNLIQPVQYNGIDMGLYDTGVIRSELEMLWGIQEALSSSVQTAKTATEAELMQQGTMARISYRRDSLEELLTDLGQHTAEIALQKMAHEDVVTVAGPEAYWPEGLTVEELDILVSVEIRAGTTGKPDTSRQREAWATIMPLLQSSIMQVGQLRGSSPLDIAECIEELVAETLSRTGERIDADRFLPDVPQMMPGQMPGAPMGAPPMGGPLPTDPGAMSNDPGIPAAGPDVRAGDPAVA